MQWRRVSAAEWPFPFRMHRYMRAVSCVLMGFLAATAAIACGDDSNVAPVSAQEGGRDASSPDASSPDASSGGTSGGTSGAGGQGEAGRDSAADGGSSGACTSDQECPTGQKCDTGSRRCVECMATTDCPKDNDCIRNTCTPYTSCVNTRDCPTGLVCSTTLGRCVECVTDAECGDDRRCGGNVCRPACVSDLTCRSLGLLCDVASGYCVECVGHADCAAAEHCVAGVCQADVCMQGSSRCENNAIVACDAVGSKLESPQPCSTPQICAESSGAATCRTRICTPSAVFCGDGGNKLVECSADGFTQTVKQDCASTSQSCVARACRTVLFAENFEDGDFNGWTAGSGNYVREVLTGTAADGTTRNLSLRKYGSGGAGPPDGTYRTFNALQPTTVSFWIYPGITQRTEFHSAASLSSGTGLVSFLAGSGNVRIEAGVSIETPITQNAWHHIEFRNIDWNARTFDYFLDGVAQSTGVTFVGSGTAIWRMDMYGYIGDHTPEGLLTGYWDEIVFQ